MTNDMFVDSSALVAVILNEPEGTEFNKKIELAKRKWICGLNVFEVALALIRVKDDSYEILLDITETYLERHGFQCVEIDAKIARAAVDAFAIFGKGRHKAKLNMGDCFSYACAKKLRLPLLFKGNDFIHTDIQIA